MKRLMIIIIGLIFICGCAQHHEYPKINQEFEIQDLTSRTISYYYDGNIYQAMYNSKDNLRLINKAKNSALTNWRTIQIIKTTNILNIPLFDILEFKSKYINLLKFFRTTETFIYIP